MKFLVLFEDAPDAPADLRQRHMGAHLDFLEAHAGSVAAAGPLHRADGTGAGGVWVVDADGAEAVEALIRADPFYPTGLRKSWQVLRWTQVFADGARRV